MIVDLEQESAHTRGQASWLRVQLARHPERPHSVDYIQLMCDDFFELRGDRHFGNDRAILSGYAAIGGQTVMLIGHQKGRSLPEKQACMFGMPHPEGYRKAQRLMLQAEQLRLPVITLIDTAGAYPGIEAEQRGISMAIAENLLTMSALRTPIISAIIGEGGSGGALAIGVADSLLMMEHAIYSVASPEAAASILWRDSAFAAQAAAAMRITAPELLQLGLVDEIIPEPAGGAHQDYRRAADSLKQRVVAQLAALQSISLEELLERRYHRLRSIGGGFSGAQKRESLVHPHHEQEREGNHGNHDYF